MNLSDIIKKPELVKVELDDEETVEVYKEPLTFYTHDRQPFGVFIEISEALRTDGMKSIALLEKLVLNEKGERIISAEAYPPHQTQGKVLAKIMEVLGK